MKNDYLIVHKSILPSNFSSIIEARDMIEHHEMNVSFACKKVGISRSTYYKYKDYVFAPTFLAGRRAIIGCHLQDEAGILSNIINYLASIDANIITIHQETPLHEVAYVVISMNIDSISHSMDDIINQMKGLRGVKMVTLIAIE
ncbi:MAG: ACT domain-containing protein [Bacilli bacterium]|nr:ACT domain-containing protein [Bacilli bacterium]